MIHDVTERYNDLQPAGTVAPSTVRPGCNTSTSDIAHTVVEGMGM